MTHNQRELRKIAFILAEDNAKKAQAEKQMRKAKQQNNQSQILWLKKVLAITNSIIKHDKQLARPSTNKPKRKASK